MSKMLFSGGGPRTLIHARLRLKDAFFSAWFNLGYFNGEWTMVSYSQRLAIFEAFTVFRSKLNILNFKIGDFYYKL
ncbi:hypothetical protein TSUD_45920 [Trifolium subterraneum]|nr:hypothetical protein TSUD_45920 [Trifolium subterraneum]